MWAARQAARKSRWGKREREFMQWRLDIMKEITTSLKASSPVFRAASSPPSQAPPSPTPTTYLTKCPNNANPRVMVSSSHIDEETTPMVFLELGDGEDKVHDSYIVTKNFPEVTSTMCSMKCSSPDTEPDLTMTAVVACATTATASMEVVSVEDTTGVTYIDTYDYSKVTHVKRSKVGLDVDGGTDQDVVAFQTMMGCINTILPGNIKIPKKRRFPDVVSNCDKWNSSSEDSFGMHGAPRGADGSRTQGIRDLQHGNDIHQDIMWQDHRESCNLGGLIERAGSPWNELYRKPNEDAPSNSESD
uniref:Uncharacterized protein n=1 Tax=Oryza nivara TaxID=4536 RepID=A0A0E0J3K0_ORYNI